MAKLDVLTLSGYSGRGGTMTPHQRRFKAAAKRCHGDPACMSKAMGGSGRARSRKRRTRRGMGILPGSGVTGGTTCTKTKKVYSPYYGKKVERCAEFSFKGKGSKPGFWSGKYADKYGWSYNAPNAGESCKGFQTVGRGCSKVRCASFTTQKGAKTAEGAKAACRRAKGLKAKPKSKKKKTTRRKKKR